MEGLRQSLMAPSAGTIVMLFGCFHAMGEQGKLRYAAKDDDGKPLLKHPYEPWVPIDPKYKNLTDAAYRGFKMFENVKEWTLMSGMFFWGGHSMDTRVVFSATVLLVCLLTTTALFVFPY